MVQKDSHEAEFERMSDDAVPDPPASDQHDGRDLPRCTGLGRVMTN
jgi:hypothetical protein